MIGLLGWAPLGMAVLLCGCAETSPGPRAVSSGLSGVNSVLESIGGTVGLSAPGEASGGVNLVLFSARERNSTRAGQADAQALQPGRPSPSGRL